MQVKGAHAPFGIGLMDVTLPIGAVTPFAGNLDKGIPHGHTTHPIEAWGWMVCDGRTLDPTDYPELFATLGYLYGKTKDQFNLPDFRGMFLRGIVPTPATHASSPPKPFPDLFKGSLEERVAPTKNGSVSGVGSVQDDALQTHQHTYAIPKGTTSGNSGTGAIPKDKGLTSTPTSDVNKIPGDVKVSAIETRSANVFVYYLIKYTYHLPVLNNELLIPKF